MDTPANAVVKNSIFSNHKDEEAIEIDAGITGTVSHCLFFDYTVEPALGDIVPTDTIWADPQFADAANGDFTLAGTSPAVGAADDGTAIGDSRWDPTAVSIRNDVQVPGHFNLAQNYPNPFNPTTSIQFSLMGSGYTVLTVYNMLGQEMATLLNTELRSGTYEVTFDAADLPSGIYIYQIQSGGYTAVKKMLLLK